MLNKFLGLGEAWLCLVLKEGSFSLTEIESSQGELLCQLVPLNIIIRWSKD